MSGHGKGKGSRQDRNPTTISQRPVWTWITMLQFPGVSPSSLTASNSLYPRTFACATPFLWVTSVLTCHIHNSHSSFQSQISFVLILSVLLVSFLILIDHNTQSFCLFDYSHTSVVFWIGFQNTTIKQTSQSSESNEFWGVSPYVEVTLNVSDCNTLL